MKKTILPPEAQAASEEMNQLMLELMEYGDRFDAYIDRHGEIFCHEHGFSMKENMRERLSYTLDSFEHLQRTIIFAANDINTNNI